MSSDAWEQYLPETNKNLRACLQCKTIMTKKQFFEFGCPGKSCKELQMKEEEGRVLACTTESWKSCIAIMNPTGFVSRFNGFEGARPGFYTLAVDGKIPDLIPAELAELEEEQDIGRDLLGIGEIEFDRDLSPESDAGSTMGKEAEKTDVAKEAETKSKADAKSKAGPKKKAEPKPKAVKRKEPPKAATPGFDWPSPSDLSDSDEAPEQAQKVQKTSAKSKSSNAQFDWPSPSDLSDSDAGTPRKSETIQKSDANESGDEHARVES
jgi:hypothetical protein|mmetsp:Transcript_78036/g.123124  ORF Transcript_78036/g.123124 Transcript_78036/m.123124 type:complete len:266 (+) Transcript_78036:45-842(+)